MKLYGDLHHKELSEKVARALSVPLFYPEIHIFPDKEKRVRVLEEVLGEDIYLIKSLADPVEENILEFAFLINAFINKGARSVTGIVPYMGYMRADHIFRSGEAVPLEVIIKTIEGVGLSRIWIVDPHSIKIPELFSIPVKADTAVPLFAAKIKEIEPDLEKVSIVSPDMGGIRRLDLLSGELGGVEQVIVNKDRDYETGEIQVAEVKGTVRPICFIVDDIISTGKTVVQAVDALRVQGAEKVYVMATHPLLAADASKILQASAVDAVFVTDAIAVPKEKQFEKLKVITLAPRIASAIREWNAESI